MFNVILMLCCVMFMLCPAYVMSCLCCIVRFNVTLFLYDVMLYYVMLCCIVHGHKRKGIAPVPGPNENDPSKYMLL